jgi:anti-sigma regulatory factor (Ser/Thr protein kinase)
MTTQQADAQLSLELPYTPEAPSTARSQLRLFAPNLEATTIEDALVMVSELVTNALLHGAPEITLHLWLSPDRLTVAVSDLGEAAVPRIIPSPPTSQSYGRGLWIVNALATRWGVSSNGGGMGKRVWFNLARTWSPVGPAAACSAAP